jgi:hypothetical protein
MAISSAALLITSWEINPLNPDGTVNSFLPAKSGASPADLSTDLIDYLAMGNLFQLKLYCSLSGSYPDTSTPTVVGSTIRYVPGLFLDFMGVYNPPGTFPSAGYAMQLPGSYNPSIGGVYTMPLIGQRENLPCNINGEVEIEFTGTTDFIITHQFWLTADIEQYLQGKTIDNFYRLSKSDIYNEVEDNVDRASVFSEVKGLNIALALSNRSNAVYADYLSIPFNAAFSGRDIDGTELSITCEFFIERVAVPSVSELDLSPFEDNLIRIVLQDSAGDIVEDESEIMFVDRFLERNVDTFVNDLDIKNVKAVTNGASTQLDGPIYSPVTFSQSAGVTEITFIVKGDLLTKLHLYQVHFRAGIPAGPSSNRMIHFMSDKFQTTGAPVDIPFGMESMFWTRNGESGEAFTITPAERCTSILALNATEYNAMVIDPWLDFDGDIQQVKVQILDDAGTEIFSDIILKNEDNSWTNTAFISLYEQSGPSVDNIFYFRLNEFRIPFENYQSLPDWTNQVFTFRWTAYFQDQKSTEFSGQYFQDTELTVGDFDTDSVSPVVTNIKFLNPDTLEEISDWHDLTTIRVTAEIADATVDTYVSVMIDMYPLGVTLFNDYALEEEDPTAVTLPPYVVFEQKASDLISELPEQPTDGGISFLVDVSEILDQENMYLFIQAYQA